MAQLSQHDPRPRLFVYARPTSLKGAKLEQRMIKIRGWRFKHSREKVSIGA